MNISDFIGHTVLIICRYEQKVFLNKSIKFWFINKTTAKVILVWNFDLKIFTVYGHGAWFDVLWSYEPIGQFNCTSLLFIGGNEIHKVRKLLVFIYQEILVHISILWHSLKYIS